MHFESSGRDASPSTSGSEPQAIRSVILITATTLPSLNACSFVLFAQVQTWFFFAVKVLPSCTSRSSPSVMWQTMAFFIGLLAVFDPGCMMMSRMETVLKFGMIAGNAKASRPEVPPLGLELLSADVPSRVALAEDLH